MFKYVCKYVDTTIMIAMKIIIIIIKIIAILKTLLRAYNLIINNKTRSLNIFTLC